MSIFAQQVGLISLLVALLLAGCTGREPETAAADPLLQAAGIEAADEVQIDRRGAPPGDDPAAPSRIRIGVAWAGKAEMPTRVSRGLVEALAATQYEFQIEWQRELVDLDELDAVAQRFQKEKDGMVLLRSSGAEYLGRNPPTIPAFIGGCNHPVQIGALKNMAAPEGNVTGVTYALSYGVQFETFKAILPDLTTVLLITEEGHPGSAVDRAGTRAVCGKLGIHYSNRSCRTREEVIRAARDAAGEYSAIILGNQALVFDDAGDVVQAAGDTPTIAFSSKPVRQGVLCGLAADDVKLGHMLGRSVVDVLLLGKAIRHTPVKVDTEPRLYVNLSTAERIGVQIPFDVLAVAEVVR